MISSFKYFYLTCQVRYIEFESCRIQFNIINQSYIVIWNLVLMIPLIRSVNELKKYKIVFAVELIY